MVDPPILDRQRPRRVEAQYRDRVILEKRAEVIADITLVPAQRRSEAARKIIERNVVIARNDQQFHARRPQPVEPGGGLRSEEHTSELQSLMRTSYAVFCLKTKTN